MSKAPFEAAPEGKLLNSGERKKLLFMGTLVVLVIVAFVYVRLQDSKRSASELNQIADADEEFTEQLVVPSLDPSTLAGKVLDAREGDRVLLQRETLDPLLEYADSLHSGHFSALGIRALDAEAQASLAAAPEEHRAEVFLARGWLDDLDQRVGTGGEQEHHGRLRLRREPGELGEGPLIAELQAVLDVLRARPVFLRSAAGRRKYEKRKDERRQALHGHRAPRVRFGLAIGW